MFDAFFWLVLPVALLEGALRLWVLPAAPPPLDPAARGLLVAGLVGLIATLGAVPLGPGGGLWAVRSGAAPARSTMNTSLPRCFRSRRWEPWAIQKKMQSAIFLILKKINVLQ